MRMDKINQWLSLIGNLGVIAGIIFLAIELKNNTRATEAQTRNSMTENLTAWQMDIGTNEFAANIWHKGNTQFSQLTPVELAAYSQIIQSTLRNWENEWYQYQNGLFTEEEFRPRLDRWERVIVNCPIREICGEGRNYSSSFSELMNSTLETSELPDCE